MPTWAMLVRLIFPYRTGKYMPLENNGPNSSIKLQAPRSKGGDLGFGNYFCKVMDNFNFIESCCAIFRIFLSTDP